MIVRNWMRKDFVTIQSDALLAQAMALINEHSHRYLPVVDGGVLRGVLRRRDLYEAATAVTATMNVHELRYFNERLKVKDIMIRRPKTIDAAEPVESAMRKGAEWGVSFFPVMDQGEMVGTVSYEEIFETFSQILGVREDWVGITLEGLEMEQGTLKSLAEALDESGAVAQTVFTLRHRGREGKKVVVRLRTSRLDRVLEHLRARGYRIMEVQDRTVLTERP
jgi:acetoin utilization protein AcuB